MATVRKRNGRRRSAGPDIRRAPETPRPNRRPSGGSATSRLNLMPLRHSRSRAREPVPAAHQHDSRGPADALQGQSDASQARAHPGDQPAERLPGPASGLAAPIGSPPAAARGDRRTDRTGCCGERDALRARAAVRAQAPLREGHKDEAAARAWVAMDLCSLSQRIVRRRALLFRAHRHRVTPRGVGAGGSTP